MAWEIKFTPKAEKALSKIDKKTANRIIKFLLERTTTEPRNLGKCLSGPLGDFWRYRVGDYRILAKIEDDQLIILVVEVGHRSEVYKRH
ncbi:type II toxin-antitoxin system RelE family toxin [Desulfovibrio inopinatus]|uniref:type II toxin-antitoxin system RelE family toxin n=1 Tax=Desulfovibrio inopinatus TaxID=102109 RepID=UPI000405609C|nr:type II toxin-antitoxin system RelE/ParE family toxin [Desulfovibrio inopinatus]